MPSADQRQAQHADAVAEEQPDAEQHQERRDLRNGRDVGNRHFVQGQDEAQDGEDLAQRAQHHPAD